MDKTRLSADSKIVFKDEVPDEDFFERFFGSADLATVEVEFSEPDTGVSEEDTGDSGERSEEGTQDEGEAAHEAGDDQEAWAKNLIELSSKVNRDDYSVSQWNMATLIPPQDDGGDGLLPIRNPDGTLNLEMLADAENALLNKKLKMPVEVQRQAMATLINMIRGADRNMHGELERQAYMREGRYSALDQEALVEEFEREADVAFTGPLHLAEAKKVGKRLWKTLAMPYRRFKYMGSTQNFTPQVAKRIEANFKAGAVPDPGVFLVKDNNEHTDNPEYLRGRVVDVKAAAKGLEVTTEMDERGHTILENAPWVKASPFIHHNYYVEADEKRYGPSLLHLAITPRGHLPEAGGWERVALSNDTSTTVIALEDDPEEKGEDVSEEKATENKGGEGVTEAQSETQEQVQASATEPEEGYVKLSDFQAQQAELEAERAERRRDKIEGRWQREFASRGVGPAAESHILPLLLSTATDPDREVEVFKLSENTRERTDETEQVKLADQLWKLAEFVRDKKGVPLDDEQGTETVRYGDSDDTDGALNEQVRASQAADLDEKIATYMKENNIDDYGFAARQVFAQEGVTR